MFWAIIKASLVGWYFMHLKFEGKWVYSMLVPAGILAAVFIFAPDARHRHAAAIRREARRRKRRPPRSSRRSRRARPIRSV